MTLSPASIGIWDESQLRRRGRATPRPSRKTWGRYTSRRATDVRGAVSAGFRGALKQVVGRVVGDRENIGRMAGHRELDIALIGGLVEHLDRQDRRTLGDAQIGHHRIVGDLGTDGAMRHRHADAEPVLHRAKLDGPREVALSPGAEPGSEPETQALIALIRDLEPEAVVALHAPLACIDDPNDSELGRWLAERTGLPLVPDVGYPTPGSFGTWGAEQGLPVVTYEFGLVTPDEVSRVHVPVLVDLLQQPI